MPLGQHAIWKAWGGIALGQYAIGMAWGGMGWHAIWMAWAGMGWHAIGMAWAGIAFGRQCHPCLPLTCRHNGTQCKGTQCIAAPCCPNGGIAAHIQVAMGRQHGMAAAMHLGGIAHRWQCTKNQIAAITLAAKHLGENIKNLAFTNPPCTAARNSSNYTGSKAP